MDSPQRTGGPDSVNHEGTGPVNEPPKEENAISKFFKNLFSKEVPSFSSIDTTNMDSRTIIHWASKTDGLNELNQIQKKLNTQKNESILSDKDVNLLAALKHTVDRSQLIISHKNTDSLSKIKQSLKEFFGFSTTANLDQKLNEIYDKLTISDKQKVDDSYNYFIKHEEKLW